MRLNLIPALSGVVLAGKLPILNPLDVRGYLCPLPVVGAGIPSTNKGTTMTALQAYNMCMNRRARQAADEQAAIELVLEAVHPDNLGDLPPSRDFLVAKAYQLGLL